MRPTFRELQRAECGTWLPAISSGTSKLLADCRVAAVVVEQGIVTRQSLVVEAPFFPRIACATPTLSDDSPFPLNEPTPRAGTFYKSAVNRVTEDCVK